MAAGKYFKLRARAPSPQADISSSLSQKRVPCILSLPPSLPQSSCHHHLTAVQARSDLEYVLSVDPADKAALVRLLGQSAVSADSLQVEMKELEQRQKVQGRVWHA
eukprot:762186-Hanusia_phi.AAC.3